MSNKKISQLQNVASSGVTPYDLLAIVNYDVYSGTTKNIRVTDLKNYINSGSTDTYVTGYTYQDNIFTISDSSGNTFSTTIDTVTGLTVNGTLSATTISGNTFYGDGSNLSGIGYTYEIGEYVSTQGGVIAHRWLSTTAGGSPTVGAVQNYLVVDIDDLSGSTPFEPGTPIYSSSYFSSWDGLSNNTNLIANGGGGVGTAVNICVNSTNNGKTDWYLPAIDELSKIWQNRFDIAQGLINAGGTQFKLYGFVGGNYYCSSTAQGETVAVFNFSYGHPIFNDIANPYIVRAVRKFSI
jgi:hypothetical protein